MTAEEAADVKRLFGVVAEDLRSEIRAVAEGVAAGTQDLARFRAEVREEFGRVQEEFDRVHRDSAETRAMLQRSHGELDRRIIDLESGPR